MFCLYDCNNVLLGRYKTMRGAKQARRLNMDMIRSRFDNRADKDSRIVCSIVFAVSFL